MHSGGGGGGGGCSGGSVHRFSYATHTGRGYMLLKTGPKSRILKPEKLPKNTLHNWFSVSMFFVFWIQSVSIDTVV